jgi:DNA mismatch repair ATPase MutS
VTPYTFINSQINIPDCKGKASLFEAEMYRCKSNIDALKGINSSDFAFLGMDEIFNSTNPVEGIAGAYAIISYIAKLPNVSSIVTTHYLYLTKLKKECSNITTYKMNILQQDNKIKFPYLLKRGISRQYIALDLLKLNGFDNDILEVAQNVKDKLISLKHD